MNNIFLLIVIIGALTACGGAKLPETRYYQLVPDAHAPPGGDIALAIDPLATDQAYDDERIVYRQTPYRLDYYNYHRWSAAPGTLVGDYLESALEHSGVFSSVTREPTADTPAVLGGRVVAIEEVDRSKTDWVGRIVIELTLTDTRSSKVIWTKQYEQIEPLGQQTPEALAKAISTAMGRIANEAARRSRPPLGQRN